MRFAASITFLFTELPFLDRFAAARDGGFEGVEIQVLPDLDLRSIDRTARRAGMEVALLNVEMGDLLDDGPGLSGVPGREDRFAQALDRALEAAGVLDARCLHLGPSRIPSWSTAQACREAYARNLARARDAAQTLGGARLVIEAMNRLDMPDALLPSLEAAEAALGAEPAAGIGLLFDIYHVAMNGEDVLTQFDRYRDRVAHVQFSNMPGRHEPGSGALDVRLYIDGLVARGYEGWFGAEYRPTRETRATLDWLNRRPRAPARRAGRRNRGVTNSH